MPFRPRQTLIEDRMLHGTGCNILDEEQRVDVAVRESLIHFLLRATCNAKVKYYSHHDAACNMPLSPASQHLLPSLEVLSSAATWAKVGLSFNACPSQPHHFALLARKGGILVCQGIFTNESHCSGTDKVVRVIVGRIMLRTKLILSSAWVGSQVAGGVSNLSN